MRKQFELSDDQFDTLVEECKPVRYMVFGGMPPSSPQENANRAWCALGREMGFDGMTVEPVPGSGDKVFTAEATG